MPSSPKRDDGLPAGVPPGQVQRILVGFGTGVTEKHPGQWSGTEPGQRIGQGFPRGVWYRGGIEEKLRRLLGDGPDHLGMAVAGGSHRMTTVRVQPLVTVLGDQPGSPAANRPDRELGVDGEEGRWTGGQADRRSVHRIQPN